MEKFYFENDVVEVNTQQISRLKIQSDDIMNSFNDQHK